MKEVRSNNGSTMVAVIGIGLISTLWLAALMQAVLPSYNRAANGKHEIALRSTAEACADWGVAQLNVAGSGVDDPYEDGAPGPVIQVPTTVLGEDSSGTTALIQVSNERPPADSYIYDPTLDPANAATNGGITTNGWRTLTASIQRGRIRKDIRVICKPSYAVNPVFDYGIFGRSNVTVEGTAFTDSYDSGAGSYAATRTNIGGNIGSNRRIDLTGNSVIGGNLVVLSDPPGGTGEVVSGTANVRVEGELTVNGTIHSNGSGADFTSANVSGRLQDGSTSSTAIETQQTSPQRQIAAAPTAPATAIDLGAVSVMGSSTCTLSAPGDYIMSSLQVGGRGQLVIAGTGPVRIFVQGTGSHVMISGNGIVNNNRPQDLQIYYNGTSNTAITGNGTFRGTIYAPNSNLFVSGNGGLYGAAVANEIRLNSTGLHYDRSLANFTGLSNTTVSRLQTISWQEL